MPVRSALGFGGSEAGGSVSRWLGTRGNKVGLGKVAMPASLRFAEEYIRLLFAMSSKMFRYLFATRNESRDGPISRACGSGTAVPQGGQGSIQ